MANKYIQKIKDAGKKIGKSARYAIAIGATALALNGSQARAGEGASAKLSDYDISKPTINLIEGKDYSISDDFSLLKGNLISESYDVEKSEGTFRKSMRELAAEAGDVPLSGYVTTKETSGVGFVLQLAAANESGGLETTVKAGISIGSQPAKPATEEGWGMATWNTVRSPFYFYRFEDKENGIDGKWFPEWREHPVRTTIVTVGYAAVGYGISQAGGKKGGNDSGNTSNTSSTSGSTSSSSSTSGSTSSTSTTTTTTSTSGSTSSSSSGHTSSGSTSSTSSTSSTTSTSSTSSTTTTTSGSTSSTSVSTSTSDW
jgi:hypothetical protein